MAMKTSTAIAFVFAALAFGTGLMAQPPKPVRTQSGLVQGTSADGIAVYKGIPFAAPPLASLRWRAPQPAADWAGPRTADKFAPACMQVPIVSAELGMEAVATSEDCLYLNVWSPAKSPSDRLAVMVWIYG